MKGPPAAALVRLERYLAGLPGGLDGHPAAAAKGSLVRNTIEGLPADELLPRLPPALRRLVAEPPMAGEWIPETHFVALYLAVTEVKAMTESEIYAWARERNRALFTSAAYRILMSVVSPTSLIRFGALRWNAFHRGSHLDVTGISDDGVRFGLRFPHGVFDAVMLRVFASAFCAALELANAGSPEVLVEAEGAGFARYVARW